MKLIKPEQPTSPKSLASVIDGVTEDDERIFQRVISVDLGDAQASRVASPDVVHHQQDVTLAVHWHPEFVPMNLISKRINAMFPNKKAELIIPTDHNIISSYDGKYCGVEADCYSEEFNQKIQLLIHFRKENEPRSEKLASMLAYTFKYRSSQLFDFMNTITKPDEARLEAAAKETGADEELIGFVRIVVKKISALVEKHYDAIPELSLKNKILRNFFDALRADYADGPINRAQAFLTAVKQITKAHFTLQYFYKTQEIIEEARSIGACIVIPHPEQFWPVLLADYDVDGIEVWNPQSRKYTEFLISSVDRRNSHLRHGHKTILTFMGDDTHLGEKTRLPEEQDKEKAGREVGLQPAWDEFAIRKKLIVSNVDRFRTIEEYKSRLDG